jgi:predicted nucleotidyltransferase
VDARIREELARVERERNVRVLYACESGSRAWGFASPDSDWDVRFLYIHPRDWYLSIESHRDVIEEMLPDDLDLAGWDLRKALGLLRKSNPSLVEWLRSPIVYVQDEAFMSEFRPLADRNLSLERSFLHYLHMAQGNYRAYLQGDQVSHKKYLYVTRPVLACRWIERGLGAAPMEFEALRAKALDEPDVAADLERLLEVKRSAAEMGTGPRLTALHGFLESELDRLASVKVEREPVPPVEPLNEFFRSWVNRWKS